MKTNMIVPAATLSLLAAAAIVLSVRSSVDAAIGYVSVLALVGMAALEYRINWKRLFNR